MKGLNIILVVLILSGCASSMYVQRVVDDGIGGKKEMFFAYGKFCGVGYPPNLGEIGRDNKKRILLGMYPPLDDLDAICYAHDYCYDLPNSNNVTCDSVFHRMIIDNQSDFKGKGCWNLSTNIIIVFFGKNWEKGNSGSESGANRFVHTALGIPTAIFWTILKVPLMPFLSDPIEGTCNIGEEPDYIAMIKRFEEKYKTGLFNDKNVEINIPARK